MSALWIVVKSVYWSYWTRCITATKTCISLARWNWSGSIFMEQLDSPNLVSHFNVINICVLYCIVLRIIIISFIMCMYNHEVHSNLLGIMQCFWCANIIILPHRLDIHMCILSLCSPPTQLGLLKTAFRRNIKSHFSRLEGVSLLSSTLRLKTIFILLSSHSVCNCYTAICLPFLLEWWVLFAILLVLTKFLETWRELN